MFVCSWKAPEHILRMPETRHQRVRKRLHILTEGEEIPPPIKTFKVSRCSSFYACFVSVRSVLDLDLNVYQNDDDVTGCL